MSEHAAAAFTALYRAEYSGVLAFFVRRVDDVETARDLTAEAFRIAWVHWEDERQPDRAWLFGVARNLTGDEYRRRRRHRDGLASVSTHMGLHGPSDADGLGVHEAVEALPAPYQEVLMLTYWEGLAAAEVGRVLGISRSAVWVRLHRARKAFAAVWDASGMTPTVRQEAAIVPGEGSTVRPEEGL